MKWYEQTWSTLTAMDKKAYGTHANYYSTYIWHKSSHTFIGTLSTSVQLFLARWMIDIILYNFLAFDCRHSKKGTIGKSPKHQYKLTSVTDIESTIDLPFRSLQSLWHVNNSLFINYERLETKLSILRTKRISPQKWV